MTPTRAGSLHIRVAVLAGLFALATNAHATVSEQLTIDLSWAEDDRILECTPLICGCPAAGDGPPLPTELALPTVPVNIDWESGTVAGIVLLPPFQYGGFDVADAVAQITGTITPERIELLLLISGTVTSDWHADYWLVPGSLTLLCELSAPHDEPGAGRITMLEAEVRTAILSCVDLLATQSIAGGSAGVAWTGERPVILIHGLFGTPDVFGGPGPPNLQSLLEEIGYPVWYFSFPSMSLDDWNVPLEEIAADLNDSLATWSQTMRLPIATRGVSIIGYSMGGLVADYLLGHPEVFPLADQVESYITLGTPHHGAAAALYGSAISGTVQAKQMEFGNRFLWDLHQTWAAAPPPARVLCVVGASSYLYPHDGTVLLPSASLLELGHPVCYIPNDHIGIENMAYITHVMHPSYTAIATFLAGDVPPSNAGMVAHLSEGMQVIGLFDPGGEPVPVGSTIMEEARVVWTPDPSLFWFFPWWPWLSVLGNGVGESGFYYATGADVGIYTQTVFARTPGYKPIFDQPLEILPRQARIDSLTVEPADAFDTQSIPPGDAPPILFAATGVTVDFHSGPGGTLSVTRVDEAPPTVGEVILPRYWDLSAEMEGEPFLVDVTLPYDEADVAAAGLVEGELSGGFLDRVWLAEESVVDPVANTVTVTLSHLRLLAIGDFDSVTSPVQSFALLEPAHGDTGVSVTPTFVWRSAGVGDLDYIVYVGTDPLAGPAAADSNTVVVTSLAWPEVLAPDTSYVWWVRATDGEMSRFSLSGWQQFHTTTVSAVEGLRLTGLWESGRIVLRWQAAEDGDHLGYHVWRATQAGADYARLTPELIRGRGPHRYVDESAAPGNSHYYRLEALGRRGNLQEFGPLLVRSPASPLRLTILPNRPNPFAGTTAIRFVLPRRAELRLSIYDAAGHLVRRLLDGARPAGVHSIPWDGRNGAGAEVSSGIYFYQLQVDGRALHHKMLLLRSK